jgi:hypothetical protein
MADRSARKYPVEMFGGLKQKGTIIMRSSYSAIQRPAVRYLAALLCLFTGCGSSDDVAVELHPVRGEISFQGKPIAGAIVSLHPKVVGATDAPNPRASVQADGRFELSTFAQHDGAPAGDYVLTVQWFRPVDRNGDVVPGPNVLPKKYSKPETSKIDIRVASGSNDLPAITLR